MGLTPFYRQGKQGRETRWAVKCPQGPSGSLSRPHNSHVSPVVRNGPFHGPRQAGRTGTAGTPLGPGSPPGLCWVGSLTFLCQPFKVSPEVSLGVSFFRPLELPPHTHTHAVQFGRKSRLTSAGVLARHGMESRVSLVGRDEGRGACWRQRRGDCQARDSHGEAPSDVFLLRSGQWAWSACALFPGGSPSYLSHLAHPHLPSQVTPPP